MGLNVHWLEFRVIAVGSHQKSSLSLPYCSVFVGNGVICHHLTLWDMIQTYAGCSGGLWPWSLPHLSSKLGYFVFRTYLGAS